MMLEYHARNRLLKILQRRSPQLRRELTFDACGHVVALPSTLQSG